MEFSNVSDIGNFEIEDLMDIPTQSLVGKRQDESNGIYSYPISETDFQTKLFERIPANTTLPLDPSGWIFNEVTVTIFRHRMYLVPQKISVIMGPRC